MTCQAPFASQDTLPQEADLFACAQQLAREGNFVAAQIEYRALTESHPENVDYWFGLAQVQHWSGDDAGALQAVARARALEPGYEDIGKLEQSILAGRGERSARNAFRWEAGADVDRLDNNSADWQRAYLYFDVPLGDQKIAYASYARFERFDRVDTQLGVGGSMGLAGPWFASIDALFSSSPAFLPESAIGIHLGRRVGPDWVIGGGLGNRHYTGNHVIGAALSVERYAGNFRIAYLADFAQLDASTALTQRATINYYADRGSQYGLSIAGGKEVESVGAGEVLETDVFAIALSGRHPLGRYLSIIWRLGFHRQGDLYDRYTTGLSFAGGY
ncbi:MAG TPA: YaiO family outer membrane beta-barrel protein [Woeseiaceae bacterium]|nr:YaiO family outer membrane beta-barrel protein [Woeseiaceae bacterium]